MALGDFPPEKQREIQRILDDAARRLLEHEDGTAIGGQTMTEVLVAIGGDLEIDTRMELADAGFREVAQVEYSKAVWPGEMGFDTGLDIPKELLEEGTRRLIYTYEAIDEEDAAADAREIVGSAVDLRVSSRQ
jgi:hypothetical protein